MAMTAVTPPFAEGVYYHRNIVDDHCKRCAVRQDNSSLLSDFISLTNTGLPDEKVSE